MCGGGEDYPRVCRNNYSVALREGQQHARSDLGIHDDVGWAPLLLSQTKSQTAALMAGVLSAE